jgi:hypothetical protein
LAGLILNAPYGFPFLPKAIHKRLSLTPEDLRWENWRLTDPFLLDLVQKAVQPEGQTSPLSRDLVKKDQNSPHALPTSLVVSYPYSPLVADPLGLIARELGQTETLGPFILTHGSLEKSLPVWSESEREFIFSRCVKPYFQSLEDAAKTLLATEPLVLIVTIRFFAARPFKLDHRENPRPQVNLGFFEESASPKGLIALAGHIFRRFGLWTELDYPLVGSWIPDSLVGKPRIKTLGLALRRDLYLDETLATVKPAAGSLIRILRAFFVLLGQELDRVYQARLLRAFPPKPPSNVIKAKPNQTS